MSKPNQWYLDALERKRKEQIQAALILYWTPRVLGLIAVLALVVIAVQI